MRTNPTTRTLLAIAWIAVVYGVYYTRLYGAALDQFGLLDRVRLVLHLGVR
ncbi:MAG TPA: hypothetical protein VEI97_06750 [bacterium]|nr:hypothetical protein [bacterium]